MRLSSVRDFVEVLVVAAVCFAAATTATSEVVGPPIIAIPSTSDLVAPAPGCTDDPKCYCYVCSICSGGHCRWVGCCGTSTHSCWAPAGCPHNPPSAEPQLAISPEEVNKETTISQEQTTNSVDHPHVTIPTPTVHVDEHAPAVTKTMAPYANCVWADYPGQEFPPGTILCNRKDHSTYTCYGGGFWTRNNIAC
jgi:hypothetical protein